MADPKRLLDSEFWHPASQQLFDGRANVDLVDLIEKVRLLRRSGRDVRFVAHTKTDPQGSYDRAQALGIQEARKSNPDAVVISVMGNNHARVDEPHATGALLRSWGLETVNLNFAYFDPAEHESKMFVNRGTKPRIVMEPSAAFDGFLYVVTLHDAPAMFPPPHASK